MKTISDITIALTVVAALMVILPIPLIRSFGKKIGPLHDTPRAEIVRDEAAEILSKLIEILTILSGTDDEPGGGGSREGIGPAGPGQTRRRRP
ncbi:hypothetical protein [Sphingomonas faeni]|uniref:hypothetical protein n=1 Tax=Sphingomonas faeni TaxID=185950 RepID=UPI0020BF421D|nr:hypothetical protein [Sphingomonas faeni]MCK8458374.1 hypothetical protein [Sphingomonas faeni]